MASESIDIRRDESDGAIELAMRIEADVFDDALALLSCWWLRWISSTDCAFFHDDGAWHTRCRLQSRDHGILPHVLRDMLAIRNALCM